MTPDVSTALVVAALGLILLSRLLRWTRRSVRRLGIDPLRPALLVAGALLAAGLILAISLSYSTKLPVVRAQSSETVLLPHKSTWSYFYDGVPSTATTGVAPFTMNPCGAAGTAWDPSKSHIEMNGTFRVEGAPQTVKVRVRTAGADPGSPLPNQVQIWVNNALIADYPQPNGECDTEWNNEITVNSALLSRGPNTIRVKTGRFPGTFTRRAVDIEVVAASVDPAPADASFGTDLLRQGLSTDPGQYVDRQLHISARRYRHSRARRRRLVQPLVQRPGHSDQHARPGLDSRL
jgi:hypothetical protein